VSNHQPYNLRQEITPRAEKKTTNRSRITAPALNLPVRRRPEACINSAQAIHFRRNPARYNRLGSASPVVWTPPAIPTREVTLTRQPACRLFLWTGLQD